jgi:acyl-CoA synthetase (NDP forming)
LAKALNHVPSIHIENNSIVKNTEGPAILVITDSHENRKVTL